MKISVIAAVAAMSVFGIASSASAMCGPTVSFNLSQNTNDTNTNGGNDGTSVQEFGLSFNDSTNYNSNSVKGLTASIGINFSLDGGRGCQEQDLRITQQKDQIARAARQEALQHKQQAAALINNIMAGIAYCESADLNIPANAQFCTEYLSN